jgi:hypothetical protein
MITTGAVGAAGEASKAVATGVAGTVAELPGVASGAALVGRGVCAVGGVARGVVLIASGCPQLVSANTSSKSLQKRTTSLVVI